MLLCRNAISKRRCAFLDHENFFIVLKCAFIWCLNLVNLGTEEDECCLSAFCNFINRTILFIKLSCSQLLLSVQGPTTVRRFNTLGDNVSLFWVMFKQFYFGRKDSYFVTKFEQILKLFATMEIEFKEIYLGLPTLE